MGKIMRERGSKMLVFVHTQGIKAGGASLIRPILCAQAAAMTKRAHGHQITKDPHYQTFIID